MNLLDDETVSVVLEDAVRDALPTLVDVDDITTMFAKAPIAFLPTLPSVERPSGITRALATCRALARRGPTSDDDGATSIVQRVTTFPVAMPPVAPTTTPTTRAPTAAVTVRIPRRRARRHTVVAAMLALAGAALGFAGTALVTSPLGPKLVFSACKYAIAAEDAARRLVGAQGERTTGS